MVTATNLQVCRSVGIALLVVTSVREKIPYVYIIEFSEHKV